MPGQLPGLDASLIRIIDDVEGPLYLATAVISFILGLVMIAVALNRIRQLADGPRSDIRGAGIAMRFFSGGMLLSLSVGVAMGGTTIFGDSANVQFTGLSYQSMTPEVKVRAEQMLSALFRFCQVCGWIFFANGWRLYVKKADGDGSSSGHPLVHIGGGIALAHIVAVVQSAQATIKWAIIN